MIVILSAPAPLPPSISLLTPNIGSSAGGWAITITGTRFNSGATVTFNGVAATSVVVVSSTSITCVAPAYSTPNGSSSPVSVVVTNTNGGTISFAGYYYLPSNNGILFAHRADVGVSTTSSHVTGWSDLSGNGNNWIGTSSLGPTVGVNFGSTSLPYLAFNGTNQTLTMTLQAVIASGAFSQYIVAKYNSVSSVAVLLHTTTGVLSGALTGGQSVEVVPTHFDVSDTTANNITVASADTNPHVFGSNCNTSGTASGSVDSTLVAGTLLVVASTNVSVLGAQDVLQRWANANVLMTLLYTGQISTADAVTVRAILKATSGTP